MKFQTQTQSVRTSPINCGVNDQLTMANIADGVTDEFKAGHVVLVDESGITGRWDGTLTPLGLIAAATSPTPPEDEPVAKAGTGATEVGYPMLAIVVADKFEGDESLSLLRFGDYVADKRVVLADDSRVTAAARITLSRYGLFDKGTW